MKEISVALGGGGIRGIAHIGVLRALENEGFKIKAVTGTSAGGLVGAIYSCGFSPDNIEEILAVVDQSHFFSLAINNSPGLLSLEGLAGMLSPFIGDRTFDSLDIPFACTAVDLDSAQEIVIDCGRVLDAALATAAFPGVFPPVKLGHFNLVDGGVLDPVPVALARWLAPELPVFAVCLSPEPEEWGKLPPFAMLSTVPLPHRVIEQVSRLKLTQTFQVFTRSMDVVSRSLTELRLQIDKPEVIIRPDVVSFGLLDSVNPKILIDLGEQAVQQALPNLKRRLMWNNRIFKKFKHPSPPGVPISAELKTRNQ